MHAAVEVSKIFFEVLAVCLSCSAVNADSRTTLECVVRPPKQIAVEMVEQCRRASFWFVPYELT